MVNLEREYKFGLPNNWSHFTVQQFDMVKNYLVDVEKYHMTSIEYDTETGIINAGGHSLRTRTENDTQIHTLKIFCEGSSDGRRSRNEYEVTGDCTMNFALHDIFRQAIDTNDKQCQNLICSIIYPLAADDYTANLVVFRRRDFVRYDFTVKFRDVTLSIATDVGVKITTGEKDTQRIRKIDLEYKDGNIETFEDYVKVFEFITGLRRITEASVTDLNYDL